MTATCARCASDFETARRSARWCSDRCRTAAARARKAGKPETSAKPKRRKPTPVAEPDHGVTPAVIRELEAAGRADTSAGRTAIALARRLDDGAESSAGMAALTRELSARMAEATASVESEGDGIDELRARREARRAG